MPFYLDPQSYLLGVLFGIAACGVALGFVALLFAFHGADKRGLSGRHRPGLLNGEQLPAINFPTLPVVAPWPGAKPKRTGRRPLLRRLPGVPDGAQRPRT